MVGDIPCFPNASALYRDSHSNREGILDDKAQGTVLYQASNCIVLPNVLLSQTSHMVQTNTHDLLRATYVF